MIITGTHTAKQSQRKEKRLRDQRRRRTLFRGQPRRQVAEGPDGRGPADRDLAEDPDEPDEPQALQPLRATSGGPSPRGEHGSGEGEARGGRPGSHHGDPAGHPGLAGGAALEAHRFELLRRVPAKGMDVVQSSRAAARERQQGTHGVHEARNEAKGFARRLFETTHGVKVTTCGLVVDKEHPFLAASHGQYSLKKIFLSLFKFYFSVLHALLVISDAIVDDSTLLEIKYPTSGADFSSAEEAVQGGKVTPPILSIYACKKSTVNA